MILGAELTDALVTSGRGRLPLQKLAGKREIQKPGLCAYQTVGEVMS